MQKGVRVILLISPRKAEQTLFEFQELLLETLEQQKAYQAKD